MAVLLYKALEWEADGMETSFAAQAEIPPWARESIRAAFRHGVLNGRDGNRFAPGEPVTRAEATVALLRVWHDKP